MDTEINKVALATVLFHRGEIVESIHRAFVTLTDINGEVLFSLGDPEYATYLRSSAKPLQALSLVSSGALIQFNLSGKHLAIATGSHSGTAEHQQNVLEMLDAAELSVSNLQCGVHAPFDDYTRTQLHVNGKVPQPIHHNCSGKHAAMMLSAKALGENVSNYLDFDHPVQRTINEHIARFAGIDVQSILVGRDGCSAPVHALRMTSAAQAFACLVDPQNVGGDDAVVAQAVVKAMRDHPEMVAGNSGRICTPLMRQGKFGLIAKAGAEGYYAAAWIDPEDGRGRGMTVKVEDGNQRARDPLVIALLQRFGVIDDDLLDSLLPFAAGPIRNHADIEVGRVEVRI
ncbi:asparaginase [Calditrichota bacterium]